MPPYKVGIYSENIRVFREQFSLDVAPDDIHIVLGSAWSVE